MQHQGQKKSEKPAIRDGLCPASKDSLARDIGEYLSCNMERRVTIDALSAHFHVSPTLIKTSFRAAYGMPVYTYFRTQKMRAAARILQSSDDTVLDIAGRYGYDNGSKFAHAFQDVMGMTPTQYRRMTPSLLPGEEIFRDTEATLKVAEDSAP